MHGIYITVIVILAIALIFKSSNGGTNGLPENSAEEEKENTEQMLKDASVTIIKNTNPKPASTTVTIPKKSSNKSSNTQTTTIPIENTTQNTTEEPQEELLPITGQIGFFIDKLTTEIKGEDWGKVVKIKFTITNQKPKSFYPKVLVYCWDDDDEAEVRSYVEEEIYFDKLDAGKSITEEKSVSVSFNEIDKEKTLKAALYDEDDEELDTAIEKFTLS